MRIVQIIDSLELGGAEKMAVSYANALSKHIEFSGIIATRKEGNLKSFLEENTNYLFLNKKKTFDFIAFKKLYKYLINNNIKIIQAHSTSFFIAVFMKFFIPKLKIVWHDHYGKSIEKREKIILIRWFSLFFSGIIAVNQELKNWAEKHTFCKSIIQLNNFVVEENAEKNTTQLFGIFGKRILCLANFRRQKNQVLLLEVAKMINQKFPDWTFHLVGKNVENNYFQEIENKILIYNLQNNVFCYNNSTDVFSIITQCDIAVLSSFSEGLPVALLEYGICEKPVIATAVGEIPKIITKKNGILVASNDVENFAKQLEILILNPELRITLGENLYATINTNFTEEVVIEKYLNWLQHV